MLVMSPDRALTDAVRRVVAARPLEVTVLEDIARLADLPDSIQRETLVALVDVDLPGACEILATEERHGGRLFGITLLAVSDHPILRTENDDDDGAPSRWSAAFPKPIPARELLRVIDREIAFENYDPERKSGTFVRGPAV